jgi:hypothetical protein
MAKQKQASTLAALKSVSAELVELVIKMQMTGGTSPAWKHLMKAAQHTQLALLHSLDPEASEAAVEWERLEVIRQHGQQHEVKPPNGAPPPLIKRV